MNSNVAGIIHTTINGKSYVLLCRKAFKGERWATLEKKDKDKMEGRWNRRRRKGPHPRYWGAAGTNRKYWGQWGTPGGGIKKSANSLWVEFKKEFAEETGTKYKGIAKKLVYEYEFTRNSTTIFVARLDGRCFPLHKNISRKDKSRLLLQQSRGEIAQLKLISKKGLRNFLINGKCGEFNYDTKGILPYAKITFKEWMGLP